MAERRAAYRQLQLLAGSTYGVSWIDSEISPNAPWAGTRDQGYIQESLPQAARIRTVVRFSF